MMPFFFQRLRGPTLMVQILILLVGGLVIAQLVTLLLTLLLPPAPTPQYDLRTVAAALREAEESRNGNLQHIIQPGPPDLGGRGWLVSERSRTELATLLKVGSDDVRLSFYTPLPFAGTVAGRKLAMSNDGPVSGAAPVSWTAPAASGSMFVLAQASMPPVDRVGPILPRTPDGQIRPRIGAPNREMLPPGVRRRIDERRDSSDPSTAGPVVRPPDIRGAGQLITIDPTPLQGRDGIWIGGDRGEAVPPILRGSTESGTAIPPIGAALRERIGGGGLFERRPMLGGLPFAPSPSQLRSAIPAIETEASRIPVTPMLEAPRDAVVPERRAPVAAPAPTPQALLEEIPFAAAAPKNPLEGTAVVSTPEGDFLEPAIPLLPRERGLFGLAPAPFVEGDFVAALRLPDGRWSVVQPAAEPFPNSWQRRVLLWFIIAFATVAPLAWLFSRRIVKPLRGFADAAEALGRDPTAAVIPLDGPAEIGRAANAFNVMQSRVKSFVGDRTAMIGAISHDLRTPLTRLRFRIEEVDDDAVRAGMIEEVEEMEMMITSVLAFIRDASAPGVRERLDLGAIVEDVVADAAMIGGDVRVERLTAAPVEVDVLGMRRLFANLVENAVKYGDRARLRLSIDQGDAVAEIIDEGPGVPEEDLERAFEPFYRAANARSIDKRGNGLGLAVCRSIARAHGGDVHLMRSPEGFKAQLRLPLAYDAATVAA
ncbi:HAMP domain-containing protein [Sphingomonas montanisoli]|uniref:histidine kinase n=2 Tax=Sphingomonas montanisoli TaxID=2606412 RepID=A0A5D9BZ51_9SPHN|nr:HAMP domain-containing protein [Sphingomonas montanisoli]